MTRENARREIEFLDYYLQNHTDDYSEESHRAMMMAVEALEQEPCEDYVSRKAVLEQTYDWSKDEFLRVTNPFDYLRKRINSLPSVDTERKVGYWIENAPEWQNVDPPYICSECGLMHLRKTNYCDQCGAKMILDIGTKIWYNNQHKEKGE